MKNMTNEELIAFLNRIGSPDYLRQWAAFKGDLRSLIPQADSPYWIQNLCIMAFADHLLSADDLREILRLYREYEQGFNDIPDSLTSEDMDRLTDAHVDASLAKMHTALLTLIED